MLIPPKPLNEESRLAELQSFELLDTPAEIAFDEITELAAKICGVSISCISLIDTNRQWFKSKYGLAASETSRDIAFCAHAVLSQNLFVVPDTHLDDRFSDNPLVIGDPHIRFYAAIPLHTNSEIGLGIGTLCVIDRNPKHLSQLQIEALRLLGEQVKSRLLLRKQTLSLQKTTNALRKSEETRESLLRAIQQAMEGIAVLDREGRFIYMNNAHASLYGYTEAELLGQTWSTLYSPASFAHLQSNIMPVVLKEGHWAGEMTGCTRLGQAVFTEIAISLLEKDEASTQWIIYTSRDVTEQKQAHSQLAAFAEEMARKNRELAVSQTQAMKATQAKSNFLSTMSHEIRTPMNAIVAMADLLYETSLQENQKQYVDRLIQASGSLLDLINDVLDMSKIEAGMMTLEIKEFSVCEVVERVSELLDVRAEAKGLELVSFVHPDVPSRVEGDPVRLRQVLINLVGNAIKFTERGEVSICVSTSKSKVNGLVFSVSDTGIGIDKDAMQEIFDPFTQLDNSTTRKHGGTGLGLSISRELVALMGGELNVLSAQGYGSTFSFTVAFPESVQTVEALIPQEQTLSGLRAVIVDDNETNRLALKAYLAAEGVDVTAASSAKLAIAEIETAYRTGNGFNILLTDYRMPQIDGLQLAATLRSREEFSALPIVMCVSDWRDISSQLAKQLNIASVLYKPITRSRLVQAIGKVYDKQLAHNCADTQVTKRESYLDLLSAISILVVDDLEDNRDLIRLLLNTTDYKLDCAANGVEAVEKCQRKQYDLVLMDIQMPIMDGFEATAKIRQWEKEQQRELTPIVALTAHAFKEELEKCIQIGCTSHITKPLKKITLLNAIKTHARKLS